MEIENITIKELQSTLKVALKKMSIQDFSIKLGTIDYDKECIYFRVVSKYFFTMENLMTESIKNCE
jgi:hypothetical protein